MGKTRECADNSLHSKVRDGSKADEKLIADKGGLLTTFNKFASSEIADIADSPQQLVDKTEDLEASDRTAYSNVVATVGGPLLTDESDQLTDNTDHWKLFDPAIPRSEMPGKPWKKRERPPPPDVSGDYKWSSQSYTMREILNNFRLPVVVQCREETSAQHLQNFFFDLHQPVLLHSKRTSRKVFARCIRKGEGGTIKELLPEVVIPEDYEGWFKISKGLEFNKPSPHKTIDSITRSNTEFFLCTTEFDAIVVTETLEDNELSNESISRPVVEGEVLRKLEVRKLNQLMLSETQRSLSKDNRYLMCIDEKDCELFIPVSQTGLFYEVSDGNFSKHDNCVVQISDIIDEMVELPLYVRHILGDPPHISKFYSPCLKLMRVKEEETIMGSTFEEDDALPFEIQTNSPIKFEIALNTPMLQSCTEYAEAVNMCNNVNQTYVTDMKLAVTFQVVPDEILTSESTGHTNFTYVPDENEHIDSVSNSQRTSNSVGRSSDLGEIDANSEFSIKWDPSVQMPVSNSNCPTPVNMPEPDCVSIESLNEEQAQKLNTVLGGNYFTTDVSLVSDQMSECKPYDSSSRQNTWTKKSNADRIINIPAPPFCSPDVVEESTSFSVYSTLDVEDCSGPSTSTAILRPPSPFTDDLNSLPSSVTVSTSKVYSFASTLDSDRGQIDLSEHFPSIHSGSSNVCSDTVNVKQAKASGHIFRGDVYISPDLINSKESVSSTFSSNESIDGSWQSWNNNKFRVIRSKDIPKDLHGIGVRRIPNKEIPSRSRSSSEDLMQFDEPSRSRASSTNSIITCKVADEMVSSCNDLRISLEEITKKARDEQVENSWHEFCLERSSSLPVRSKTSPRTEPTHIKREECSRSWEQISPRRKENPTRQRSSAPTKTLNKLNVDFNDSLDDKMQLISDTSSEDSEQLSGGSTGSYEHDMNDSFALSESDMSVTDGPESVLAAIAEMDMFLDSMSTASTCSIKSDCKTIVSQQLKISNVIKRKQLGEWNDIVEVI